MIFELPRERLLLLLAREVSEDIRKGDYRRLSHELRGSVRRLNASIVELRPLGDCGDGYECVRLLERLCLENMEKESSPWEWAEPLGMASKKINIYTELKAFTTFGVDKLKEVRFAIVYVEAVFDCVLLPVYCMFSRIVVKKLCRLLQLPLLGCLLQLVRFMLLYLLAGSLSDFWTGMVETIVCAISSMMSCDGVPAECICSRVINERVGAWEWVDMMVFYYQNSAGEDREFFRRINVLLRGMVVAYDDRVYFIWELESVSGVVAAVKRAEYLNDKFWKDNRRLQKFWNMEMDAEEMAFDKRESMMALPRCDELRRAVNSVDWEPMFILYCRRSINEDLRLAREINALCGGLTVVIDERENFFDELNVLVGRFVREKMAEFTKDVQSKDIPNLMKLQILGREFELRAQEKDLFIEKLKGNMDF
nr:hypothetical protein [Tanacetum cinerariifolium]